MGIKGVYGEEKRQKKMEARTTGKHHNDSHYAVFDHDYCIYYHKWIQKYVFGIAK